ncbi:MAG: topoisomerase DNA-binding C4 zinc finger domain-containing protein, partial [Acholeplasmatales bacterium]|nr:topoisomerase DNA-binding C4 zinc finger domain-containing protein [Acholeplasmatales bacterium]
GKNKGNEFFACSNFPKCKNIITLEDYNKLLLN